MNICKYCRQEIKLSSGEYKLVKMSAEGYYFVCVNNPRGHFKNYHKPMDNLDYIEWVAKQRGLVV